MQSGNVKVVQQPGGAWSVQAKTPEDMMSIADMWEGQPAATCGCGEPLVWSKSSAGWQVVHLDPSKALYCSNQTTVEQSGSDVRASA